MGSYDLNIIFGCISSSSFPSSFSLFRLFLFLVGHRYNDGPRFPFCTDRFVRRRRLKILVVRTSHPPLPTTRALDRSLSPRFELDVEGVCPQVGDFVLVRCACMETERKNESKTFFWLNTIICCHLPSHPSPGVGGPTPTHPARVAPHRYCLLIFDLSCPSVREKQQAIYNYNYNFCFR